MKISIKDQKNLKGFTLIELIIVFSITVILSTIGIVGFLSFSRQQVLSNSLSDIRLYLNVAKSNAISQSKPTQCTDNQQLIGYEVLLCCDSNSQSAVCPICLSSNDYEIDALCGNASVFIQGKKFPSKVAFDDANTTSRTYLFQTISSAVKFSTGVVNTGKIGLISFGKTATANVSSIGTVQ